jgi:hypothetical protein
MPLSKAQQAEVAERRVKLIRLRRQGISFDDPRILALGYSSRGAASKDLVRALKERRDEQAAEISVYRQEENERLDALLEVAWPRATTPSPLFDRDGNIVGEELDMRAVDTVLKLMDRRAKLNGLDVPVRTELSGPGGGAVPLAAGTLEELNKLIDIAGQTRQEAEAPSDEESGDDGD